MRAIAIAIEALFCALLCIPVHSARADDPNEPPPIPSPLSLDAALQRMEERGFDLLTADAAVRSAEGDQTIASAFQNPAISGGGGHTFHYDPKQCESPGCSATLWEGSVSDQGLLADLLIGKRRLRAQVAEAALAAARLERKDALRTLRAMVEQAWVETVVAGALVRTAEEAAHAAAQTADLVSLRWHAGDVSEADSARADTAKLELDQAVDAARQQLALSKAALAFLLGDRSGKPDFEVDPALPACVAPADFRDATPEELVARARAQRQDLAAADAALASADAGVALAERSRIPDIAVVGSYSQEGSGNDALQPPTAQLALQLPIPLFYQGAGEVQKARANLDAQRIARARLDAQLAADVASSFAAWQSAQSRVARMESVTLARARRALDLVDYQYRRGAASLLELLDAQRTFVSTQAEYQQNVGDWWLSLYQLEAATGKEPRS
ncbi:MAG TPA: TolC family protein [Myxococcota bacterium]|nr:TolC family protein [Myxococcota bacterium]